MRTLFAILLAFSLCAGAWADDYQPRNSQRAGEEPPSPIEALYQMSLPEGFGATLFAHEPALRQPIDMTLDDRGRLWVIESYAYEEWEDRGEDRILIFEDTDHDGRHDERTVFYDQGKHFAGLALGFGGVWIADAPNIIFIPDRNQDDIPDGPPEIILTGFNKKAKHNMVNGLQWGPDGWLYGRHGVLQWSKVGVPDTPKDDWLNINCGIWRYHPQTKILEHVVRGTTNPWGLDWDEQGELFMSGNVNGHLWHVIPGAFLERMHPTTSTPYVYERLTMSADVPHYAGSGNWKREWNKGAVGRDSANTLGGGHSHCGAMIYLGDQWPDKYRGMMFMANTHGRRINMDKLTRRGGSFVGTYEGDFMRANQSWFRGVSIMYGPDGAVYLSDWTDDGECHDNDGVHRSSGRIYKITYGQGKTWQGDLSKASDHELLNYHHHKNAWFGRQARRLLHERAVAGTLRKETISALRAWLTAAQKPNTRLQALWTLHVIGGLTTESMLEATHDTNEHVRAWAVRLANNREGDFDARFLEMAQQDPSSLVRLYLTTADVLNVIVALAERQDDFGDNVMQRMIWYSLEPKLSKMSRRIEIQAGKASPWLEGLIARRLFEPDNELAVLHSHFREMLETKEVPRLTAILKGYATSYKKRQDNVAYPIDDALERLLNAAPNEGLVLAIELEHQPTIKRFMASAIKDGKPEDLQVLMAVKSPEVDALCQTILQNGPASLRAIILPSLPTRHVERWQDWLFTHWNELTPQEQPLAIDALISNKHTAKRVIHSLADGQLKRHDINAAQAQKIAAIKDSELSALLETHWGSVRQSTEVKQESINRYRELIASNNRTPDQANGKALYASACGACHKLFNDGGKIGPDLTGSDRGNIDYLLNNIVDPNASVASDYRLTVATGKNGNVITGSIIESNKTSFLLRTLTVDTRIAKADVQNLTTMKTSLMPEGLLDILTEEQVIDLIAYLRSHVAAP